jgi:hypothetical protein
MLNPTENTMSAIRSTAAEDVTVVQDGPAAAGAGVGVGASVTTAGVDQTVWYDGGGARVALGSEVGVGDGDGTGDAEGSGALMVYRTQKKLTSSGRRPRAPTTPHTPRHFWPPAPPVEFE